MIPDQVKSWLEVNKWGVIIGLVGIVLIGCGVFWYRSSRISQPTVQILSASTDQKPSNTIYIDISGAVNKPGVYQVGANTRVGEALAKAGGISPEANLDWVAKNLNQASPVKDGMKLYIPRTTEVPTSQNTASEKTSENLNINSASSSELEALPGIGPVTAGKIISGRPYQTVEDLVSKKIVSQKVYDQIKNLVSAW